jgi:hypothetical protein
MLGAAVFNLAQCIAPFQRVLGRRDYVLTGQAEPDAPPSMASHPTRDEQAQAREERMALIELMTPAEKAPVSGTGGPAGASPARRAGGANDAIHGIDMTPKIDAPNGSGNV